MNHRQAAIIVFGPPASGKGTQSEALARLPGFTALSSGAVLRRKAEEPGDQAEEIRRLLDRGDLVPDERMLSILRRDLEEQREHGLLNEHDILLLDGFPRTVAQARQLDELAHVLKVMVLSCTDEAGLRERIRRRARQEHRAEDMQEDAITHRLEIYRQETEPVIEHYREVSEEAIAEIDALQSPPEVLRDVLKLVIPLYQNLHGLEMNPRKEPGQHCR